MAKNPAHQKGIIKRYYEHKEDISSQRLGEIISELYLETKPVVKMRLWGSAQTALINMLGETKRAQIEEVIKSKDVQKLAKLYEENF